MSSEHVLCYVIGAWAYFTSQPLDKQWGDDWNDAPYEHNAGHPYDPGPNDLHPDGTPKWTVVQMVWDGPFELPCDHHLNSPYSVEQINAGAVAWLRTDSWCKEQVVIPAGVTISEFVRLVKKAGGRVWKEVEDDEDATAIT